MVQSLFKVVRWTQCLVLSLSVVCVSAQNPVARTLNGDSLVFNFENAKKWLFDQNLNILAAHYDVQVSEALVIQVRNWNNPYLMWNQDAYSVEKNSYFRQGFQRLVQIEQIFSISGKHTNNVKLAKINAEISRLQLEDVIRGLIMELSEAYTDLESLQRQDQLYTEVMDKFDQLIDASEQKLKVGGISGNELLRLRSEMIALQTDALEVKSDMEHAKSRFRTVLQLPASSDVRIVERLPKGVFSLQVGDLIGQSLDYRPDYLLAQKNIGYQARNLKLQQSIAMPDIKFGFVPHDGGSNYVRPYSGFNLEFSIPFFDRNQGNIKAAKFQIKKAEVGTQVLENQISNEVIASYNSLQRLHGGLEHYDKKFLGEIEELKTNASTNFTKKNISLLEYIDQQRIYMKTLLQYIEVQEKLQRAVNQLNFAVGRNIVQ